MSLFPWFLNPWAEVRRLRGELKWRDHMRLDMAQAWRDERRENYQRIREANVLKDENADLRRRIAEMEKARKEQEGMLNEIQQRPIQLPKRRLPHMPLGIFRK